MADSNISVKDAGGTPRNVDIRTDAGGDYRQVVVLGDPSTVDGVAPIDATAGLKVNLGADNDVTVASGTITAVTAITNALPAGTNNIGDVDVLTVNGVAPAFGTGARGATVQRVTIATDDSVPVTNAGITTIAGAVAGTEMQVDVLTMPTVTVNSHAVTNAGTFAVQSTNQANSGVDIGDVTINNSTGASAVNIQDGGNTITVDGTVTTVNAGDIAHDSADSGNPVKIGYKAYAFDGTAPQTAVAEADRVNGIADLQGIQYVQQSHPMFWHVSADYASAQTNVSVKGTPGASLSLYITDIVLSNGATAGNITLLDGSGGTVLFEIYPAINGGATISLRNPIKLTANTALCLTSTTVTTHSVFVAGFIAA